MGDIIKEYLQAEKDRKQVGLLCLIVMIIIALIGIVALLSTPAHGQIRSVGNNIGASGRYPSDGGRSWSTYGAKTDTSNLALQTAPTADNRVYIYEAYCVNVHASTVGAATIKFGTVVVAVVQCYPGGKDVTPIFFDPPLQGPEAVGPTMQAVGSITTLHLFASGTVAR